MKGGDDMQCINGKLFQKVGCKDVVCFSYDLHTDYYKMVLQKINEGFKQCILTSPIMIACIEYFLLQENVYLTGLEFFVEDTSLQEEVNYLINKTRVNGAYWSKLKKKLEFLSKYDSVDIKKAHIKGTENNGFLLTLQVNGIISVSENAYETISQKVVDATRRVIF